MIPPVELGALAYRCNGVSRQTQTRLYWHKMAKKRIRVCITYRRTLRWLSATPSMSNLRLVPRIAVAKHVPARGHLHPYLAMVVKGSTTFAQALAHFIAVLIQHKPVGNYIF